MTDTDEVEIFCTHCGFAIEAEIMGQIQHGENLGFRWVHAKWRLPICPSTVATPPECREEDTK